MIKLTYKTEEGIVEAEFKNLDDMEKFQEARRRKAAAKAKLAESRRLTLEKAQQAAKEAEEKKLQRSNEEIRNELKKTFLKARDRGLTASRLVDLICEAANELFETETKSLDERPVERLPQAPSSSSAK